MKFNQNKLLITAVILLTLNIVSASQWTSSLNNGLVAYWNMNDTNDITDYEMNLNAYEGTPRFNESLCKIGNCFQSIANNNLVLLRNNKINFNETFTWNVWVRQSSTGAAYVFGRGDGTSATTGDDGSGVLYWGADWWGDASPYSTGASHIVAGTWYMYTIVQNKTGNNITLYENGVILHSDTLGAIQTQGMLNSSFGTRGSADLDWGGQIDEMGYWNRTLGLDEIIQLYNSGSGLTFIDNNITLNSPVNNLLTLNRTIIFNCSAKTSFSGYYVQNISLYINDIINYTITEGTDDFIEIYKIYNFSTGNYNWTCKSTSTSNPSVISSADARFFNISNFLLNSIYYNSSSYQSSSENFLFDFNVSENLVPSDYNFVFNNTEYSTTLSEISTDRYTLSTTLIIPSNINGVIPFYFKFKIGDDYYNSSFYNITITPIIISYCNLTNNISFLNITLKDLNLKTIINGTLKLNFNLGTINFSFENTTNTLNNFAFCFIPNEKSYLVASSIEYEAPGYSKNYYYLLNEVLTNITTNLTLYLLNSSESSVTQIQIKDATQTSEPDVYVQIQKYDISTDSYYTVAMAKTDLNGEDVVYLNWYNTFYKYILTQNGEIILISNSSKIYESPVKFIIPNIITFSYTKFQNLTYSLTFNNATNNFILTFVKPSGGITSGCLRVVKRTLLNDTIICDQCSVSSSATLYCNIASYGNGTYIASFYATGSLGIIDTYEQVIGIISNIFNELGNNDGTIYAILFGVILLSAFLISPVFIVFGICLAILASIAMGFQPINYMETFGIIAIGIVIILILKK